MRKLIVVLLACSLVSCGPSAKVVQSWFDINKPVAPIVGKKTLVLAMVKNETSRRIIEDQLVKRFKNEAVASYRMLTPEMIKAAKPEALEKFVVDGGFSHVLLMRLTNVEEETRYVPGTITGFYGGYGMYYGYGANFYSTPGYYSTDKKYDVETAVFTVTPNELIYTCTTEIENPKKVDKAVNQIADLVVERMTRQGFLAK